jgi:membrane fusion protein (multidrug efflux system)
MPTLRFPSRARPVSTLGGHACLLGLTALLLAACDQGSAASPPPAPAVPTVTAVELEPQAVTLRTTLPGRTAAFQTAEVRPQVSGVLRERLFQEGARVSAGQPLFQIDAAPYRAQLASAEAALAKAQATLGSARATVTKYRPLVAQNAISRLEYETALATQKEAEADVASAKAAVETARIDLDHTRVVSPISGATSRSGMTVGALVTAEQTTALVTVTQLDPIYVDVVQPATTLLRLRRALADGTLTRDPSGQPAVRLLLEDGSEYPQAGTLKFSEVTVSTDTNTVTLRAQFPNPDGTLMPGMFVRAQVEEGQAQDVFLVPQQAVSRNAKGEALALVIGTDGTVQSRVLQATRTVGDKWLVQGGLQPGDRVIVEGLQRVQPGTRPQVEQLGAEQFDQRVVAQSATARG